MEATPRLNVVGSASSARRPAEASSSGVDRLPIDLEQTGWRKRPALHHPAAKHGEVGAESLEQQGLARRLRPGPMDHRDGDDGDHRGHDQTELEVTADAVGAVDQQLALSTICAHTGHLWTP